MHLTVHGSPFDLDADLVDADEATVRAQVREYERGDRHAFDLAVVYPDSFTGEVMRAMAAIPYGETRTYGALAADLGSAAVAVGQACGRNPLPVVVPCHRVVGADGLGGFSNADGLDAKRRLLAAERGEGLADWGSRRNSSVPVCPGGSLLAAADSLPAVRLTTRSSQLTSRSRRD